MDGCGQAGHPGGMVGGVPGFGVSSQDMTWPGGGGVRRVAARWGEVGSGEPGWVADGRVVAVRGVASHGPVRMGKARLGGTKRWEVGYPEAGQGKVWRGLVRQGQAGSGMGSQGVAWLGVSWRGTGRALSGLGLARLAVVSARRDKVWHVLAGQGTPADQHRWYDLDLSIPHNKEEPPKWDRSNGWRPRWP